jgi:hypothetical protein
MSRQIRGVQVNGIVCKKFAENLRGASLEPYISHLAEQYLQKDKLSVFVHYPARKTP